MSKDLPIEIRSEPEEADLSSNLALQGTGAPYAFGPGEAMDDAEPSMNWRRYVSAIYRYKWLIVVVILLGTAAGGGASKLIEPEYRAQGTIWIEVSTPGQSGPIQQAQLLESYAWIELLRSFEVLEHVARVERLYLNAGDGGSAVLFRSFQVEEQMVPGGYRLTVDDAGRTYTLFREGDAVGSGLVGEPIGREVGFDWHPEAASLTPGLSVEFSVTTPRDAAVQLNESLQPQLDVAGNFMKVNLTGFNPVRVAQTLNTTLDRYVELAAAIKKDRLTELTSILLEQLRSAERKLRDSEEALETFRVRTITLPSEDPIGSPVQGGVQRTERTVFDNFFDMQIERDQIRQDRNVLQRSLTAPGGVSVEALEGIPIVEASSELQGLLTSLTTARAQLEALRNRYTEDHPAVQRAVTETNQLRNQAIPDLVRLLVAEMARRESELDAQIASASRNLEEIPRRSIEEARLRRNVDISEDLYTNIQQRYEEARLSEASSIPDVRVLDRAVAPQRPENDRAAQFIAMAFMASLGIAVVGAILLDKLDRRVRYPEQVTDELGLRILGVLPRIPGGGRRGPDKEGLNQVVEALRGLRLNLIHGHVGPGPLVMTITSPGSGDGKSFVSSNIALSFAEAGYRTILIDGDIRRGRLHRLFNLERKPGLSEILQGAADVNDVVQATEFGGLSFIACGTRTQAAPELLGSTEMSQLLKTVRTQFNVVIVDSPPMGAGVDPFALGGLTGNLMLVIRNGATDRELAEAKLDVLQRLPIRVLGAVLNDVRPGRAYGYGYYSYYIPGYAAEDEPDPEDAEVRTGRLFGRAASGKD